MTDLPKTYRAWILKKYAEGPISDDTFNLEEKSLPDPSQLAKNHILVKVEILAFEPSMRPSISTEKSYQPPQPLEQPMWALGIGKVVGTNSNDFKVGSKVHGRLGMQEYALIDTTKGVIGPYDESLGIEHLAALGAPGNAAHLGLFHTAQFKKGESLLVSGAGGATGLSVIQLAKGAGASRIIGIASKSKRDSVLRAGADECLDYNAPEFVSDLRKVTEEKINVYFDNTGGPITDAAIRCMAKRGRIAVCGAISEYQKIGGDEGSYHGIQNWRFILTQELIVTGFIKPNMDPDIQKAASEELKQFVREGKIKSDIYTFPKTGIEHCIDALLGLFSGQNSGKMTLRVAEALPSTAIKMVYKIDLSGKTVVVTGGNRGIGLAMSESCANAGANVGILFHSHPKAHEAAESVAKKYGVKVKAYQCDVGDAALVKSTVEKIEGDLGTPIVALMANAGVSVVKPALELTTEDFHKVFNANVLGAFNACQAVARHWVDKKFQGGSIVVTSSMSSELYNQKGLNDPLTQIFYNASKGAATNMVKGLATEFAPYGIRVNALEPGFTATEQTSGMDAKIREYQAESVPLRRFAEPHEQGDPALFLISPSASYITGTILRPDGGFSAY